MLKPYDPREHRVERNDPLWKRVVLVTVIFCVAPFAACAIVQGIADRESAYFIGGVLVLAACIYYAMRNFDG